MDMQIAEEDLLGFGDADLGGGLSYGFASLSNERGRYGASLWRSGMRGRGKTAQACTVDDAQEDREKRDKDQTISIQNGNSLFYLLLLHHAGAGSGSVGGIHQSLLEFGHETEHVFIDYFIQATVLLREFRFCFRARLHHVLPEQAFFK